MQKVETGKYVSVHYSGTLINGELFDSSEGRPPMEIKVGAGQLIKGFEDALMGMAVNEKKIVTIYPEEAYGQRDDNRMRHFPRAQVPAEIDPQLGQTLVLTTPQGQQIPACVVEVNDEEVTLDLNHPLAGETLIFEIEVVGIHDTPVSQTSGYGPACGCGSGCNC